MPYGLPNWDDLVLSLLMKAKWPGTPTGRPPVEDWEAEFPHYRRALGKWMLEHFRFEPVKLARLFADDPKLKPKLRDALYAPLRSGAARARPTSLKAVVNLIDEGWRNHHPIRAVITLNYDDLLETELRRSGITCTSVFSAYQKEDGLPVYHLHGFLPRTGDIPAQQLIFTESDYHAVASSGYEWAVQTIIHHLYKHNVLFVGVSLKDPNLRRFLDAVHPDSTEPRHFAIRDDYVVSPEEMGSVADNIEEKAKAFGQEMERTEVEEPLDLRAAVAEVCRRAHDYDRKAFNSLGVRPIWVRDPADISLVLDAIRTGKC